MSLAAKSLSAVKSNYVGTIVRVGAQFVAQILIMRELGPELVGTFGYVLLLYGVLALIIDQGFGWSLIQSDLHNDEQTAIVFSRIMFASLVGMIFVFAISYPIAALLKNELVGEVFRYSAPSCLIIGLFIVPQARLRAELRFKEIQIATSGAYVIAYPIIGVAMAWGGFGVWALLAAWYAQGIIQVGIAYRYRPHSLKLVNPLRPTTSGALGRHVAGINILNWAVDGTAGVFAGSLSAAALGNFNAAMMLARTPALQLVQTLQTILFSTASALGDDQLKLKRLYLSSLATIAFVVIPAYCYACTHADLIINLLFGDKWQNAAGIFSALSIGMIALAISTLSSSILTAAGGQKVVLHSQTACFAVMLIGVSQAAKISFVFVGLVVSVAYWLRLLMQLKAVAVKGRIAASEFVTVLRGPVVVAVLIAIPTSLFVAGKPELLQIQALVLLLKTIVLLILFRLFPRFFFCSALVDVLSKFSIGRRLVWALGG